MRWCGVQSNHHSMTGSTEDPDDPAAVAVSIFMAVVVYAVGCLAFILPVQCICRRGGRDRALFVVLMCGAGRFSWCFAGFRHTYTFGRARGGRYR